MRPALRNPPIRVGRISARLLCFSPNRQRRFGEKQAYWACGPNARPPGASLPSAAPHAAFRRPGVSAGLLGTRPKRSASRSFAPFGCAPNRQRRFGVAAGLLGLRPERPASRSFAPFGFAPNRQRRFGEKPAYWACGPNARPPGASLPSASLPSQAYTPPLRISKEGSLSPFSSPKAAGRGFYKLQRARPSENFPEGRARLFVGACPSARAPRAGRG